MRMWSPCWKVRNRHLFNWRKQIRYSCIALAEIQAESEKKLFQANLAKEEAEIKEHCVFLRNQVNLQTEFLIGKVHQFNEKLISEIDTYEKDRIDSLASKIRERENEFDEFLTEANKFLVDSTKSLSEFTLDEKKIEDSLSLADEYVSRLKALGGGKMMKYNKNEVKYDSSLLGSFRFQHSSYEIGNLKEMKLGESILYNYASGLNLFNFARTCSGPFCWL